METIRFKFNFREFEKKVYDKVKTFNDRKFILEFCIFLTNLNDIQRDIFNNFLSEHFAKFNKLDNKSFIKSFRKLFYNDFNSEDKFKIIFNQLPWEVKTEILENHDFELVYTYKCPVCGIEHIIEDLEDFRDKENIVVYCGHCHNEEIIPWNKIYKNPHIKAYPIKVKEPKFISEWEAMLENMVNPGSILYTFDDGVHWMVADSDCSFWPDNVKFGLIAHE